MHVLTASHHCSDTIADGANISFCLRLGLRKELDRA